MILVAGIGNLFKGDDGFGTEVAQRLLRRPSRPGVKVVDFGIRSLDLTYALLDGYDAVVLIDTAQRGHPPGTISVIEPDAAVPENVMLEPHDLDPARVLRLSAALGGRRPVIRVVACEPLTFGDEDGAMGLSEPVAAALDAAIATVEQLVDELSKRKVMS
ncbi:hydrogenase maturation protease [Rhodopila sp.]|uniref:hydrogenase maturation protease n=1 Tax=Rhodopila sp. TaxID=2480087 RepID=UPI003D0B9460